MLFYFQSFSESVRLHSKDSISRMSETCKIQFRRVKFRDHKPNSAFIYKFV